jgi:gliding motility-associated-like protein
MLIPPPTIKRTVFFILIVLHFQKFAGQSAQLNINNPFEHKVFIENKGQFTFGGNSKKIKYAYSSCGAQVFFTSSGLIYHRLEVVQKNEEEEKGERERKEPPQHISHDLHMTWVNSNPDVELISANESEYFFSYPSGKNKKGLTARAFTKLTYKNLFPNVDVEYVFDEQSNAIKYALIIHPGADPSQIRMKYAGGEMNLDIEKNLMVENDFGKICDHAPVTFYEDNNALISSSFLLSKQTVSFQLGEYDHTRTVVIDPLTVVTSFSNYNGAYDVEADKYGNMYVYGGAFPYEEIKFNSNGVKQWVYVTTQFGPWNYYGDFTIDPNSGSSYIMECWNYAAQAVKLNSAGSQVNFFTGNTNFEEMYRVLYSNCAAHLVIAGGAYGTNTATLDTNFTNLNLVNVLSTTEVGHDMCLLAQDNSGNVFMATTHLPSYGFDNVMLKCPAATLSPVSYIVHDNMAFEEYGSVPYINNSSSRAGFNGMAASDKFLYTYDGTLLQQWDKNSGTLLRSKTIGGSTFTSGGLSVDACDHLFVGSSSSIVEFDSTLTTKGTFYVPNTIYDLQLRGGNVYVSGKGFLAVMSASFSSCDNLNLVASGSSCSTSGTVNALASGGCEPYHYKWFPTGNTTPTVSSLPQGTYTVTASDDACLPLRQTITATVTISYASFAAIVSPDTVCKGSATQLAATGGGIYSWNTGSNAASFSTTLNTNTTFSVIVHSPMGCVDTAEKTIAVVDPPQAVTQRPDTICAGYGTWIHASGGIEYLWSTGEKTQNIFVAPEITTVYSVSVSNGFCRDNAQVVVFVNPTPHVTVSTVGQNGMVTQLLATGGNNYRWFPEEGLSCSSCSNPIATQYETTMYCVTVSGPEGCSDTACTDVYVSAAFIPNAFTPDGNNLNEVFKPVVTEVYDYQFSVYNKWGEKIFETQNTEAGWDGTFKGRKCEEDVYVYKLNFRDRERNKPHDYYGKITLVR